MNVRNWIVMGMFGIIVSSGSPALVLADGSAVEHVARLQAGETVIYFDRTGGKCDIALSYDFVSHAFVARQNGNYLGQWSRACTYPASGRQYSQTFPCENDRAVQCTRDYVANSTHVTFTTRDQITLQPGGVLWITGREDRYAEIKDYYSGHWRPYNTSAHHEASYTATPRQ